VVVRPKPKVATAWAKDDATPTHQVQVQAAPSPVQSPAAVPGFVPGELALRDFDADSAQFSMQRGPDYSYVPSIISDSESDFRSGHHPGSRTVSLYSSVHEVYVGRRAEGLNSMSSDQQSARHRSLASSDSDHHWASQTDWAKAPEGPLSRGGRVHTMIGGQPISGPREVARHRSAPMTDKNRKSARLRPGLLGFLHSNAHPDEASPIDGGMGRMPIESINEVDVQSWDEGLHRVRGQARTNTHASQASSVFSATSSNAVEQPDVRIRLGPVNNPGTAALSELSAVGDSLSIGSRLHASGQCTPCNFVFGTGKKLTGVCHSGKLCNFCHCEEHRVAKTKPDKSVGGWRWYKFRR